LKKQERVGYIKITALNGEKIKKENRTEIPYDIIPVAEVARLRGFSDFERPEFWQIRLHEPHDFFEWGICENRNFSLT